jgi:hypothetical protein
MAESKKCQKKQRPAPVRFGQEAQKAGDGTRTCGSENNDRGWKIAQLAATLASAANIREGGVAGLQLNPHIASPELDSFYAAALKRAETMLDWAEGHYGNVYAYQLFEEATVHTEEDILAEFKNAGWPGLSSKQPVMDLMRDIHNSFDVELKAHETLTELGSSASLVSFLANLGRAVDEAVGRSLNETLNGAEHAKGIQHGLHEIIRVVASRMQLQTPRAVVDAALDILDSALGERCKESSERDVQELLRFTEELKSALREQAPELLPNSGVVERLYAHRQREEFFLWCFEPTSPEGSRAQRCYRPHEIFRRCAARNWFDAKLIRHSGHLTLPKMPGPPLDLQREEYRLFKHECARGTSAH